ncbi:HNH endonuclease [Pseudoalteromonas sp. JC28]|uniref:HNH endonuclease signature motif containing protein n=1 Tax=Pseudoalteromonas sp. JC28 TaxID=2267617 RepID=UPI001573D49E|nr:HNH endonuclease signature motif containing protein [Pseudoalteromonas sp. JC28]NSY32259.1 HNH endonuclease [Pseudoalteromonas sp. JC28]
MAKRKSIPSDIKLRLFAASAGHCQRPECLATLYPLELNGIKHIAEMAHVIPHGETGPRKEERPKEDFNPDSFDNLILLCPTCHTIIDKNPDAYSRSTLITWKREHLASLTKYQGISKYDSREEVRSVIVDRMDENRAIWEKFAPVDGIEFEYNPESETAGLWEQRVKGVILPNHYQILSILKSNTSHMTESERQVYAEYKEHVRGLTDRHICGVAGKAIRFPKGMEKIFL